MSRTRRGYLQRHAAANDLSVVGAARVITAVTLVLVVAAGILVHWLDEKTFPNVWRGLWWAAQTVTSVGYGDVVPQTLGGRLLAIVVMLNGIAVLTVVIATISATFVESYRRRADAGVAEYEESVLAELRGIDARLASLERRLAATPEERSTTWRSDLSN